jgi:DNA helicase HerA-like ATPase
VEIEPGHFYLGGLLDESGTRTEALTYEAADLTTHGVIVGMTGSGKTGLGIDLLEEALLSGIPALIIDPKGDMTNLLLNFPDLAPSDFRPWIDESTARRQSVTADELAAQVAGQWKDGLASWDIDQARMRRLADQAELTVYTPGSTSGTSLNVLGSLRAPDLIDTEAIRDEIEGFVSSILVLAGIKSDPISGPEHILLATIIERAWSQKQDLDLASLIVQVQQPPFRKLGVFELDAFIPPGDRTDLALKLNGLVASPSFAAWREGEPLDIGVLLGHGAGASGKTHGAIFYLAHLSEPERQFFVTLLLSKLVTYMRSQQGSSDLRALVYMDEVVGFCPPTAEPPSKKPILTLAKQARAFGYGMVLTTQNPMDFDYKVMSNAGTWMIGRLQTERDKARIL